MTTSPSPADRGQRLLALVLAALGLFSAGGFAVVTLLLLFFNDSPLSATPVFLLFSPTLVASGCGLAAIVSAGRGRLGAALALGCVSIAVIPTYVLIFLT